tara:strand:+ start:37041 stop:38327 length:1287 start_codon:yes stop_codon:yes gene_type:complete
MTTETQSTQDPRKFGLLGYRTEWTLEKALTAFYEHNEITGIADLQKVAGLEKDSLEAMVELSNAIEERNTAIRDSYISGTNWRRDSTRQGIINATRLQEDIEHRVIEYFQVNTTPSFSLDSTFYRDIDAAIVITPNPSHVDLIENAIHNGVHVMFEKPATPLLDSNGLLTRAGLDRLINVSIEAGKLDLLGKCTEHYSHKVAPLVFFDRIDDYVAQYGRITRVDSKVLELDEPTKPRTQSVLSRDNGTGILLDTGVHPLSILVNLGAQFEDVLDADYGVFEGVDPATGDPIKYDVDTYAKVDFTLEGSQYFDSAATGTIEQGKFIDHFRKPKQVEEKYIDFTFTKGDNETVVKVSLSKPTIWLNGKQEDLVSGYSSNEYVNALADFSNAMNTGTQPITNFPDSIAVLEVIAQAYQRFPIADNTKPIYK